MPIVLDDPSRLLIEKIRNRRDIAEDEHKQFRSHAAEWYALYRGFQEFRTNLGEARDKDVVVKRIQKEWGADLHIPIAFQTVETIVPRMLAHRPRMNPLPRDDQAIGNVDNMRLLIDAQQAQIGYEIELQKICKDGLIYGLGIQKVGWRKEYRKVNGIAPSQYDPNTYVQNAQERCTFDDPYAEWVDPWAFLWDPFASEMRQCEYVIQRIYRSSDYVARMCLKPTEEGGWRVQENDPSCPWTLEDLLGTGPAMQEDQIQSERRAVEGYSTANSTAGNRHELWEYHDGDQVVVVLNGEFPVMVGPNPMPDGRLPYQAFRPTIVGGRFVGISEIEPIRDLCYELDTIRGQRVDAVTFKLNGGYFFDESMVAQDDLVIGPNIGIPVNGRPSDAVYPMQVGEVPMSAFQESSAIEGNIQSVTGISDPTSGGNDNAQTATGAQLVAQAASIRIQNKTKLMGQSVIIPGTESFALLNQSKILTNRTIPVESEGAWSKVQLTPLELQGLFGFSMDDGSTMAENVPQQRSDAQMKMALVGNEMVNQEKLMESILKDSGFKRPEAMLITEPQLPASVISQALQMMGVPPEAFTAALDQIEAAAQDQEQGPPQLPQETENG